MAFSIKNAGAWINVSGISVKDAGTWKTVNNSYINKAGTWVEFFANAIVITVSTTVTNYNLFTAAGSPTQPSTVILNINSGATIGATAGNTALTVGQFPTGSNIVINNSGSIQAYGGAGGAYPNAGSAGGDAIYASYPNQTVTINNQFGAFIYGGGGGGGSGGYGGAGGNGGGGYYVATAYQGASGVCDAGNCPAVYGAGSYCGGSFHLDDCFDFSRKGGSYYVGMHCNNCYVDYNAYTSGGAGGAARNGGTGGRGYGYDGASAAGSAGDVATGGAAGGTNAGTGGSSAAGATGGAGGTWGTGGTAGANGTSGGTGASGNYTGGSAGSAGGTGKSGGVAGRYLVKGANSVTLNNSGTVAGGLA